MKKKIKIFYTILNDEIIIFLVNYYQENPHTLKKNYKILYKKLQFYNFNVNVKIH